MTLSPFILADCKEAACLHQEAFFKGWSESLFQEILDNPLTFGMKAEEESTLLGYVLWREIADEAEILTLVVAPSSKRKGVGSFLLNSLCLTLKNKTISKLFIEVAEDNEEAILFYKSHGFIFLSKRPHYYPREGNRSIPALSFVKGLV